MALAKVVAGAITAEVNVNDKVLVDEVGGQVAARRADEGPRSAPLGRVRVGAVDVRGQASAIVLPAPDLDVGVGPLNGVDATVGIREGAGAVGLAGLLLNAAALAGELCRGVVDRVVTVAGQDAAGEERVVRRQVASRASAGVDADGVVVHQVPRLINVKLTTVRPVGAVHPARKAGVSKIQ